MLGGQEVTFADLQNLIADAVRFSFILSAFIFTELLSFGTPSNERRQIMARGRFLPFLRLVESGLSPAVGDLHGWQRSMSLLMVVTEQRPGLQSWILALDVAAISERWATTNISPG